LKIKVYKTIILLYDSETWSLILSEECRLKVFHKNLSLKLNLIFDANPLVFSTSKNLKIKMYKTILPVVLYGWEAWSL
jgi:hypothetical protein